MLAAWRRDREFGISSRILKWRKQQRSGNWTEKRSGVARGCAPFDLSRAFKKVPWIVMEKIHGANFSFICDGTFPDLASVISQDSQLNAPSDEISSREGM